uniref:EGF-like domain-containing protein n=1 Tax=Salmo trutta TaxID=8032 RepID=A0A674DET6_SALTR
MPSTWMGVVPPLTWQTAHWPATPRTTVSQSPCGAALGGSPPSCVHQCQPEDCSGYGRASMGTANARRAGVRLASQPTAACGAHGVCTQDGCVCDAGWRGENCSQVCDLGFYGDGCNQTCTCANGGSCDPVHGGCSCPIGFHGDSCEQGVPVPGHVTRSQEAATPCSRERRTRAYRAGHCLANQMFATWREEEIHKSKPYLSEQRWLIVTGLLTSLLLASLVGHLIKICRGSAAHHPSRVDNSYVSLTEINGGACGSGVRGKGSQPNRGVLEMED